MDISHQSLVDTHSHASCTQDFLVAIGITLGCTVFMLTGETASKAATVGAWEASVYGLLLMLGYLGFDGFTSTFQVRLLGGQWIVWIWVSHLLTHSLIDPLM